MNDIEKCKAKGLSVLEYAIVNEKMFEKNMEDTGKTRKTTFFHDLSIAEYYNNDAVIDTYNQVLKSWGNNIEYLAEFVICLNWKIWQHYAENEPLARIYNDLWERCQDYVRDHFKGDENALSYYYEMTD